MSNDHFWWGDPPPVANKGWSGSHPNWSDTPTTLRNHPHRWAHIGSYAYGPAARHNAWRLRTGDHTAWTPGDFEITTRRQEDGQVHLYARYIGGGTPTTAPTDPDTRADYVDRLRDRIRSADGTPTS